jgi:hypothetical protein
MTLGATLSRFAVIAALTEICGFAAPNIGSHLGAIEAIYPRAKGLGRKEGMRWRAGDRPRIG